MGVILFAHAFGQRYELPIPLLTFVLGGAGIVMASFLFILQKKVQKTNQVKKNDITHLQNLGRFSAVTSFIFLLIFILFGLFGSQVVSENILPTLFWLVIWIAVPLTCGIIGDWTQKYNPFANIAKLMDSSQLRKLILNRRDTLSWPTGLGWWPATFLFFGLASSELIYNQIATLPAVIATGLLIYFILSGFLGLIFGKSWLERGEVFTVLFSTWGRLGYFRFGAQGMKQFAGGLQATFDASLSRITFVLLLLVSVSFDGLLATPLWSAMIRRLPVSIGNGTLSFKIIVTLFFVILVAIIWLLFSSFASLVNKVSSGTQRSTIVLAGLLPSLLPISFGYLLAHNIEYLIVNGQLLFPLIGNPIGKASWPIHLPFPFNDSFEPHIHLLPSAFYWYFSVFVIIVVHIIAIILAHRFLGTRSKYRNKNVRAEFPWIVAMIAYTMLSLWLLAQPLVKEKTAVENHISSVNRSVAISAPRTPSQF